MNVNRNNIPKSAINMNNAQNLQNLQKTNKNGFVSESQEATAADRPQGETEVNKTIFVSYDGHGNTTFTYDGYDNGYIVEGDIREYNPAKHASIKEDIKNDGNGTSVTYHDDGL